MRRIRHRIVRDLLASAEDRVRPGTRRLHATLLRRAVSDAYYALFHALCYAAVDGAVGWRNPPAVIAPLYRSLDHGDVRRKLERSDLRSLGPQVGRIGQIFGDLLEERFVADYDPQTYAPTRADVLILIAQAREAVDLIEALPASTYRHLAVTLLARTRKS
jgi:hypothetical protein